MNWDAIWSRARADLVLVTDRGDEVRTLWEHASRVAENARRIAALPDVQATSLDESALVAAALYHDAGALERSREGGIISDEIMLKPLSPAEREDGASLMQKSLKTVLPAESLARATHAVKSLGNRKIESIEGVVVAEADCLDEFGALSLWTMVRRGAAEGRGIQAAIDTWHRQKEYRFWEARLKDSFRFPAVRMVAQRRLAVFADLMNQLARQHAGDDVRFDAVPNIEDRTAESPRPSP